MNLVPIVHLSASDASKKKTHLIQEAASPQSETPYKLERNTFEGKALYTYADKQKGVAYIGGDKAYQRYKPLAAQQSIEQKELEASYSHYLTKMDRVWSVNYD
jgi:hypothetical protein